MNRTKNRYFDYSLLFIVIFLLSFGLVMLYSTSSYSGQVNHGNGAHFLQRQLFSTMLGLFALAFFAIVDYRVWKKFWWLAYVVTILLCVSVMFLGVERNGAKRWFEIAGISFQPSELAKLTAIIFLAAVISRMPKKMAKTGNQLKVLLYAFPLAAIVAIENLSTGIIIFGITVALIFVSSRNVWKLVTVGCVLAGTGVAWFLLFADGYRRQRIDIWLNPENHERGFQTMQALYAIGSGGLFGKGLGGSMQKLGFVPEAQNDMIFSIICEELGLFGAIGVLLLFLLLIWRFMVIANNAVDLFGALLVTGIMAHLSLQVLLNVAVVTNFIPNTGISLPFISYGGTSVAFLLAEMGLAISVSRGIRLTDGQGEQA